MKITKAKLVTAVACKPELRKFVRLFPNGVVVTKARCVKYAQVFNFNWAAGALLTPNGLKAYYEAVDPARKAYKEAMAQAWKAYNEAVAPAWKAHNEAVAQAWKAHNEAVAQARKVLDEAVAPARKAYNKAVAIAFYDATRIK